MNYYDLDKTRAFSVSQKALIAEGDRILVLKNTADRAGGKAQWEIPGGLLEMDEDLESGLKREVNEETGIEIVVGKLVWVWDQWEKDFQFRDGRVLDVRIIELAFSCQRMRGDIQLSEEHSEFKWATRAELSKLDFSRNSHAAVDAFMKSYILNRQLVSLWFRTLVCATQPSSCFEVADTPWLTSPSSSKWYPQ
jgi:8-oxo-dGTP diphosphatase